MSKNKRMTREEVEQILCQREMRRNIMKDYRSPITLAIDNAESKFIETVEGLMVKEVCKLDLNIDKEELMKALAYDRNQYLDGYNDAKKVFKRMMKEEMKDLLKTVESIIEKFEEENE